MDGCGGDPQPEKAVEELGHWIDSLVGTLAEDAPAARLLLRTLVDQEPFPPFEIEPEGRELMPFDVFCYELNDRPDFGRCSNGESPMVFFALFRLATRFRPRLARLSSISHRVIWVKR